MESDSKRIIAVIFIIVIILGILLALIPPSYNRVLDAKCYNLPENVIDIDGGIVYYTENGLDKSLGVYYFKVPCD